MIKSWNQFFEEHREKINGGDYVSLNYEKYKAIQRDALIYAAEIANDYDGDGMDSKTYYDQRGDAYKTRDDIAHLILSAGIKTCQ